MEICLKSDTKQALIDALKANDFVFRSQDEEPVEVEPKQFQIIKGDEKGEVCWIGQIPNHTYNEEGELLEENYLDGWHANVIYNNEAPHDWDNEIEVSSPYNKFLV